MLGVLATVVIAVVIGYVVFVLFFDTKKEGGNALEDYLVKSDGRLSPVYRYMTSVLLWVRSMGK